MDDLRIYAGPLSALQVAQLYRQGLELIEQSSEELVRHIRAVYQRGESFAGTLMQCRQRIVEQRLALDLELAAAVAIRLKTDFPAEYGRFVEATGVNLNEFLAAGEPDGHVKQARRLVDLLLEYKPLTEQQWQRQTPEDRRQWEAAEQVRVKLDQLQAQASPFSADWIAFLMEVAPQIQARPERSERVAPYVPPATPVTKDLSADEARETTERDWLFQADGQPTGERIRQEIAWTRQLAARIEANSPAARFALPSRWRNWTGWRSRRPRSRRPARNCTSACARSNARSCSAIPWWISRRSCWSTCRTRRAPSGRTRRATGWATWPCPAGGC